MAHYSYSSLFFKFCLAMLLSVASALTPDIQPITRHRKAGDGQLWVGITYVDTGSSGAVCLDGTGPAYHLLTGSGSGAKNWHLHLEGGAWCESLSACETRLTDSLGLGSSKYMQTSIPFTGLLNNNCQVNPDFCNWNHVYVRYCDGASFSADVESPAKTSSGKLLYFRGKRIFKAIVDDLKSKGMGNAEQALLTGCSAGGLSAIHRCNDFQSYLPYTNVKCLSDGGFFVNAADTSGKYAISDFFSGVVSVHSLQNTLPSSCVSGLGATQCFFAENMQAYVQPPLFIVNSGYDFWQLENIKKISRDQYSSCLDYSSTSCPATGVMAELRQKMINSLSQAGSKSTSGIFLSSCFSHCQVQGDDKWTKPQVDGKSAAQSVGDWYFGRANSKHIDCAFPCNKGCVTRYD